MSGKDDAEDLAGGDGSRAAGTSGGDGTAIDGATVIGRTRAWVIEAVIGLDLCPFAKAAQVRGQVRYVVSPATDADGLLQALEEELHRLAATDPGAVETTLLIHPHVMNDFLDYNDFLEAADAAVQALGYRGVLQVASFHPHYQFEGTASDDIGNATNRSPYPTLHLLREASVARAVDSFGDTDEIYRKNIRTLQQLGQEGWARIQASIVAGAAGSAAAPGGAKPS
jgi:uncharacterized protein